MVSRRDGAAPEAYCPCRRSAPSGRPGAASTELREQLLHRGVALALVQPLRGREVDSAQHQVVGADVDDVDACRRLLDAAEESALAGEHAREQRAVHAAVQHDEQRCASWCRRAGRRRRAARGRASRRPTRRRGSDAASTLPPPEKAPRKACASCVARDVGEPAGPDLLQRGIDGHRRTLAGGGQHALGRLERARQAAGEHLVEAHAGRGEQLARRVGLGAAWRFRARRRAAPRSRPGGSSPPSRGASGRCGGVGCRRAFGIQGGAVVRLAASVEARRPLFQEGLQAFGAVGVEEVVDEMSRSASSCSCKRAARRLVRAAPSRSPSRSAPSRPAARPGAELPAAPGRCLSPG